MASPRNRKLLQHVNLLLVSMGLITICGMYATLFTLTTRIDDRENQATGQKIALVLEEWSSTNALAVEDYAYWDEAYENITTQDTDAIYENLGSGALESDLFDWLVILSPSGGLLHSFSDLDADPKEDFLGQNLRTKLMQVLQEHRPADYASESGYLIVSDEVSYVTAAWVTPDENADLSASDLPILVGGRAFHPDALEALRLATFAESIGISNGGVFDDSNALALDDINGQSINLYWTAARPGSDLRGDVFPWLSAVCLCVAFLALSAAKYFRDIDAKLGGAISLARTDQLTGLSNRAGLSDFIAGDRMNDALSSGGFALLNIDLNRFKHLNDTYGHAAGDIALQVTADRLRSAVRHTDYVVRMGGDEFLCLILDKHPDQAAKRVSDKIIASFSEPIDFGTFQMALQPSIGAVVSNRGDTWEPIFERADAAMYQAKQSGTIGAVFAEEPAAFTSA